jgi:hypothetical protein
MTAAISERQLIEASDHALVRAHEFDGADIDMKLAIFGLQPEPVRALLERRWVAYRLAGEDGDYFLFVRGFVEGLLTGLQLGVENQ